MHPVKKNKGTTAPLLEIFAIIIYLRISFCILSLNISNINIIFFHIIIIIYLFHYTQIAYDLPSTTGSLLTYHIQQSTSQRKLNRKAKQSDCSFINALTLKGNVSIAFDEINNSFALQYILE